MKLVPLLCANSDKCVVCGCVVGACIIYSGCTCGLILNGVFCIVMSPVCMRLLDPASTNMYSYVYCRRYL